MNVEVISICGTDIKTSQIAWIFIHLFFFTYIYIISLYFPICELSFLYLKHFIIKLCLEKYGGSMI